MRALLPYSLSISPDPRTDWRPVGIYFGLINLEGVLIIFWALKLSPIFRTRDRESRAAIRSRQDRIE